MSCFGCFCFPNFFSLKKIKPFYIPHQNFSFPDPVIQHLLTNGSSYIQFKLFNTSKLLKNRLRKIRRFQVDSLTIGRKYIFQISLDKYDGVELSIDDCHECMNRGVILKATKKLIIMNPNNELIDSIVPKIDISIIKEFDVVGGEFDVEKIKFLLVPSITTIRLSFLRIKNGNFFDAALTLLPNLEYLSFQWQEGITSLTTSALHPRKTKFKHLQIRDIPEYISASTIAKFAMQYISPDGKIVLAFYASVEPCTKKDVKKLLWAEHFYDIKVKIHSYM